MVKKAKPAIKRKQHFEKPGVDVILTYARRNHGRFNTTKLIELFEAEGRERGGVYGSINRMLKRKLIKRIGDTGSGSYVLLQKAVKKAKPVTNGAAVVDTPVIEEASDHG